MIGGATGDGTSSYHIATYEIPVIGMVIVRKTDGKIQTINSQLPLSLLEKIAEEDIPARLSEEVIRTLRECSTRLAEDTEKVFSERERKGYKALLELYGKDMAELANVEESIRKKGLTGYLTIRDGERIKLEITTQTQ